MKNILTLILLFSGMFFVYSQETPTKENEVDEIIDNLFKEDEVINELINSLSNFQFLHISLNYNSNTYFSGRDIGIDQYNLRPQISYINSKGIFASISGTYYSEFYPKWDVTMLTLGYGKNFGKNKIGRFSTSYSRYFYANSEDNIFSNVINLTLGVHSKNRSIGTQVSGDFLFGDDQSFQISSRSYVKINFLKTKKVTLNLRPQLNIIAGKQTIELSRFIIENGQQTTQNYTSNTFELFNTQLNIPLQLNVNSFDFELGYNINFPTEIGDETNLKNTSYVNFSVAYLIGL
ncbi:MAG: hypothetical protein R3342_10690 [Lutibacter sp.]|uniref:hypothetical protein n=1 Tax=Lutibacter sp. TaxID=1925666 RepID=UPI00299D782D|nr:hypothetical protein [Lutibacter sp.]MDX1830000.1 hypothetical protein [Lutibacter sp.]